MKLEAVLMDEVLDEVKEVHNITVGTEEHDRGVNSVTKLADRAIEIERLKAEKRRLEIEERKLDQEDIRLENEKKIAARKDAIDVIMKSLSLGVSIGAIYLTFCYDTDRGISSTLGKKILSTVVPGFKS